MPVLVSVNVGRPQPNPYKSARSAKATGIAKEPVEGPVEVRDPGPKTTGLGSGLVGDHIGDGRHHGGRDQAVYAFQREDLDAWEQRLDRQLPNGFFGENLTTAGIDVNDARIGERWRVGEVELQITSPRIPCATFRGWMQEKAWVKQFAVAARPGAYLRVLVPGRIRAGDEVVVIDRPAHEVSVALVFRATTRERELLPELLTAAEFLDAETISLVHRGRTITLD